MKSQKNRQRIWERERKKLIEIYQDKGIYSCELRGSKCTGTLYTGFAHKHKRVWYYDKENLLGDFNQTILACSQCHSEIEHNKELTEVVFNKLRPKTI